MVVPDQHELLAILQVMGKRLGAAIRGRLQEASQRLSAAVQRRVIRQPQILLEARQQRLDELSLQLGERLHGLVSDLAHRLAQAATALSALGPSAVLDRGYAICRRERDDVVVSSVGLVERGEAVQVRVRDGEIGADVTSLYKN